MSSGPFGMACINKVLKTRKLSSQKEKKKAIKNNNNRSLKKKRPFFVVVESFLGFFLFFVLFCSVFWRARLKDAGRSLGFIRNHAHVLQCPRGCCWGHKSQAGQRAPGQPRKDYGHRSIVFETGSFFIFYFLRISPFVNNVTGVCRIVPGLVGGEAANRHTHLCWPARPQPALSGLHTVSPTQAHESGITYHRVAGLHKLLVPCSSTRWPVQAHVPRRGRTHAGAFPHG